MTPNDEVTQVTPRQETFSPRIREETGLILHERERRAAKLRQAYLLRALILSVPECEWPSRRAW